MSETIAYRLTAVREIEPGAIATAAVMTCMATGRVLSGMGGGGQYLAPEVVTALRSNGEARVICDAGLLDDLVDLARRAADGEDVAESAKSIMSTRSETFA